MTAETTYRVIANDPRIMRHGAKEWLLPSGRTIAEWCSRVNAERNAKVAARRFGGTYTIAEVRHE